GWINVVRPAIAVLQLHPFGHFKGHAQADGDVVGDVVAADGENGRVEDAALRIKREVGGAAANVGHNHIHLSLVRLQYRLSGSQGVEHKFLHLDAYCDRTLLQVTQGGGDAGDDMGIYLQAEAVHPDGAVHERVIHAEVAGHQVDDLLIVAQTQQGLGCIQCPLNIFRDHAGAVAVYGNGATAVLRANVFASHAHVGAAQVIAGGFFGLLHRRGDGDGSLSDINNQTFA